MRKLLILALALAFSGGGHAYAHQPVALLNTDTTASKGPLLVDGTVSFAIRAAFTKVGEKKAFRAGYVQGDEINVQYLIVDKKPLNALRPAQLPSLVITSPTGSSMTLEIDGREIIAGFSQEIPSGAITAIVGPNGSGKSTLLAAISGLITPTSGTIIIDGVQSAATSPSKLAKVRAMAIQSQFYSLGFTVRQVIEMAGPADGVIKELELTNIADRLVTTLSGGESQRVVIAQAVAQNTPILLLDEPLAAQDIESRERIIQLLTKLADSGKTVVVVVHENEKDLTWASGNLIQIQSII